MTLTNDDIYSAIVADVNNVYGVFQNFFGEENVDLQQLPTRDSIISDSRDTDSGLSNDLFLQSLKRLYASCSTDILVHWPYVEIRNEYDKSIVIDDLYAKITIDINGYIPFEKHGFYLIRSTFNKTQFLRHYVHSHTPGLDYDNLKGFRRPCLGDGPINNTINTLRTCNDLTEWMLFCKELDTYVKTESVSGGPYVRLENVDLGTKCVGQDYYIRNSQCVDYAHVCVKRILGRDFFKDFVKYYLEKGHFKFNYMNGSFSVGMPFFDYIIDVSNAFIGYVNRRCNLGDLNHDVVDDFLSGSIIVPRFVSNGIFYRNIGTDYFDGEDDINRCQGKVVLTFKGETIRFKVYEDLQKKEYQNVLVLDRSICMKILEIILKIVNFRYVNKHYEPADAEYHSEDYIASTCEKVRYL